MQTIDKRKYFVETYAKIVKEVFPFFFFVPFLIKIHLCRLHKRRADVQNTQLVIKSVNTPNCWAFLNSHMKKLKRSKLLEII